jgi:ABC-type antimicrobial peptide transport system permease subunit
MFQFKIILRNIRRGGIYSAINIGGLAIGMAAAILILAWIYHEWSYDRFHAKEKNLYVVYIRALVDGELLSWSTLPQPLGETLKADYPEIAGAARMLDYDLLYTNDESKFSIPTGHTDPDFLTMFDFPLLQGNRETALNDPNSVILTEKAANRLFGAEDPMGKTLLVNNQFPVTVTGVMKDLPGNTLFEFEALVPFPFRKVYGGWYYDTWEYTSIQTFVELHPKAQLTAVNESIRDVIKSHSNNTVQREIFLHPLAQQHLYNKSVNGVLEGGGLMEQMRLFGVIAGLVVLIACINFTNLSTARSAKRAKEVGVRKVMGGKRMSLIRLFLGESMTVAWIAGVIALMLALLFLPVFSTLMGKQLTLDFTNGWFWPAILGFVLFTGLTAGSYPAFYLSSFLPVKVLKGVFRRTQTSVSPRKVLVVIQFTVAVTLIMSTLVIHRQIRYAQNRESGYDKDQLIYTIRKGDIHKNHELIRNDLLNSGTALSVTRSSEAMTTGWRATNSVSWHGKNPEESVNFGLHYVDADWTKTVGTTIIEGREIDVYTFPADSFALLLNETAVKIMNFEHPVGETVSIDGRDWRVVGVVKDFILRSPYKAVEPMLIGGPAYSSFYVMHIKLNGHNRMADNLAKAEQIFKQYNPGYPFEYQFVDEEYARKFNEEQKLGTLLSGLTVLTIFISCLGLFALVAYMAETRRKEIGIRKVLGASVSSVMFLLSKEFLILVLISVAIASPIAWWTMNKWLIGYAYRTDIPWWLFVVVGFVSLSIALLTVGFQAIKAATANPVKAIKSE